MMILKRLIASMGVMLACIGSASAQGPGPCPTFYYGTVLTAGQWQDCFDAKQNALGYTPLNSAGGIMTGELTTVPSASAGSGLNIAPGAAPSSPVNGDTWTTSSGIYVQVNGATVGPLVSALNTDTVLGILRSANFNSTADQAITVTLPAGATKYFITEIDVDNPSVSLTTAQGGFYTAASKGGTIIGATSTAYTSAASSTTRQRLTGITNMDNHIFTATTLYLSLSTAQGAAATGDVRIIGVAYN